MSDLAVELATGFERERPHLRRVATRILGSPDEAEDAVQEAWLRLSRTGGTGIEDPRAWLTTVTSRICLDLLRSRKRRAELPLEAPVEVLLDDGRPTPDETTQVAESVGLALHVVMAGLSPAERVAFVLHDTFGVPFAEVAEVLDRSTAAVKMLASRARRRVRVVPPEQEGRSADRAVVDAFLAAAGSGRVDALVAVLAPDVELQSVSADRSRVIHGAAEVASQAGAGARRSTQRPVALPVVAGESPGVVLVIEGRPVTLMTFAVVAGRIGRIRAVHDPAGLTRGLPRWVQRAVVAEA